jgi:hypothetical protein
MPDFGFVGAAYEAPSITQDAQECINFYPEIDPTKAQGDSAVSLPFIRLRVLRPWQFSLIRKKLEGLRTLSGGTQVVAVCGDFVPTSWKMI